MKNLIYFILTILTSLNVWAGTSIRGGGDICESRIKTIRDDIKDWILNGGSTGLVLSQQISVEDYNRKMLKVLEEAKISCVGPGDVGYPVEINGTPKVCRFDKDQYESRFKCNLNKFDLMNESDQYEQIHHEYAGLAEVELANGDDSNYEISNQISAYLESKIVKKLAVKKMSPPTSAAIEQLRKEFQSASRPALQNLRLGEIWQCRLFWTGASIGRVDPYKIQFKTYRDLLKLSQQWGVWPWSNDMYAPIDSTGDLAFEINTYTSYVRHDKFGLIIELVKNPQTDLENSIAAPQLSALAYVTCDEREIIKK